MTVAKDPAELVNERPVGDKAALDVNAGVATAATGKKGAKAGPPDIGEDAWLPS